LIGYLDNYMWILNFAIIIFILMMSLLLIWILNRKALVRSWHEVDCEFSVMLPDCSKNCEKLYPREPIHQW
jgi:hypothetical protein